MKNLFLVFAAVLSFKAIAGETWCDNKMTSKGMGPGTMMMECGNATGIIADANPLKKLKVVVTKRNGQKVEQTFDNPPGGIRDYYAIEYNDWVTNKLQGTLQYGDKIAVADHGYQLDDESILYKDWNLQNPIGTIKNLNAQNGQSEYGSCEFLDASSISYPSACGNARICAGNLQCLKNGNSVEVFAACEATAGGECPSANACMADQKVLVQTTNSRPSEAINAGGQGIQSRQHR